MFQDSQPKSNQFFFFENFNFLLGEENHNFQDTSIIDSFNLFQEPAKICNLNENFERPQQKEEAISIFAINEKNGSEVKINNHFKKDSENKNEKNEANIPNKEINQYNGLFFEEMKRNSQNNSFKTDLASLKKNKFEITTNKEINNKNTVLFDIKKIEEKKENEKQNFKKHENSILKNQNSLFIIPKTSGIDYRNNRKTLEKSDDNANSHKFFIKDKQNKFSIDNKKMEKNSFCALKKNIERITDIISLEKNHESKIPETKKTIEIGKNIFNQKDQIEIPKEFNLEKKVIIKEEIGIFEKKENIKPFLSTKEFENNFLKKLKEKNKENQYKINSSIMTEKPYVQPTIYVNIDPKKIVERKNFPNLNQNHEEKKSNYFLFQAKDHKKKKLEEIANEHSEYIIPNEAIEIEPIPHFNKS